MRSKTVVPALMAALLFSVSACEGDGVTESPGSLDASGSATLSSRLGPPILTPGSPTRIRAPYVAEPRHVHGLAEAERYIGAFGQALTRRGLDYLATGALAILAGEDGRDAELLRAKLGRRYNAIAPALKPSFTLGYEGSGECDVDFDDAQILSGFPDAAVSTFVYAPFWVQQCGKGEVRVEPTVYDHYHLVYEDPAIDCYDEGLPGTGGIDDCDAVDDDPADLPRYLGPMGGDEVQRIRLVAGGASQPFTLHSFANVGNETVRFSYKKGGDWYMWPSMSGNVIWDVSDWVTGVTEIQITSTLNSDSCGIDWEAAAPGGCLPFPAPFFVDDFSISP